MLGETIGNSEAPSWQILRTNFRPELISSIYLHDYACLFVGIKNSQILGTPLCESFGPGLFNISTLQFRGWKTATLVEIMTP